MKSDHHFASVSKPRLSETAYQQIEQAIREGRFLPGERLPSERTLTVQFGISRPVLREALRLLETHGLVTSRQGQGTFVRDPLAELDAQPLAGWLAQHRELVLRFYEARLVIEPEGAALAAQRAGAEQLHELRRLLDRSCENADPEHFNQFVGLDIDFHFAVAHASGNIFLARMLESVIRPQADLRKAILRLPDQIERACNGHERIVAAIEKHDARGARRAMAAALVDAEQRMDEFLSGKKESA